MSETQRQRRQQHESEQIVIQFGHNHSTTNSLKARQQTRQPSLSSSHSLSLQVIAERIRQEILPQRELDQVKIKTVSETLADQITESIWSIWTESSAYPVTVGLIHIRVEPSSHSHDEEQPRRERPIQLKCKLEI